jgi:hypothetical protein
MRKRKSTITWVHESELEPFSHEIKRTARELHYALAGLSLEMEHQGYNDQQITNRLRIELLKAVKEIIKEESD